MKKWLFVFLILFFSGIVVFAAGNSQGQGSSTSRSSSGLYNPPGTYPIVKKPVTLSVFSYANTVVPWEDNLMTKELETKTGIHLAWQYAAQDIMRERLNLMFASGDETDLVFMGTIQANRLDKATELLLGSQGLIMDLTKFYDTVSVGYKEGFKYFPNIREYITTPDGKIYCLPNLDANIGVNFNLQIYINTVWLKNLGLSMPTTTDEFLNTMRAFKTQDPNKNGIADEIPLSGVKMGAGTQIDGFLMSPFQLCPEETSTGKMYIDNGVIKYAPVQDGYRDGLRYLNTLFSEGLLNPDSFTWLMADQVARNEAGPQEVIGSFMAQRIGYGGNTTPGDNSGRWKMYTFIPPLKGPSGKTPVVPWHPYNSYQTGQTFITGKCKEPEAAFRLIDYIATTEGTMRARFGIKGINYEDALPGETGMNGSPATIHMLGAIPEGVAWNQLAGLVSTPAIVNMWAFPSDIYAPDVVPDTASQMLNFRASTLSMPMAQPINTVFPNLYLSTDVAAEISMLKVAITDYQSESLARFITGALSIDRDWDNYKQQLKNIGLDRYLSLLQAAYNASPFNKK